MKLVTKYVLISGTIVGTFTNFIACGAQMYKASLDGDHSNQEGSAQTANSTDPTSSEFGLHAPNGWSQLPISYKIDKNLSKIQLTALQAAMHTWEVATGKTLFKFDGIHQNITGDSFNDLYGSLTDGINGQYLDNNWKKTGKDNLVLATTIWNNPSSGYQTIETADIHYNSDIYFISDALAQRPVDKREIVDMQSLATHELGHFLGLAHVAESYDSSSIMNPSIMIGEGLASRSLSIGDVKRIQKIYGCSGSACDVEKTARLILQAATNSSNNTTAH
jgi:Matrixin